MFLEIHVSRSRFSLDWWNFLVVFTAMKMSSALRSSAGGGSAAAAEERAGFSTSLRPRVSFVKYAENPLLTGAPPGCASSSRAASWRGEGDPAFVSSSTWARWCCTATRSSSRQRHAVLATEIAVFFPLFFNMIKLKKRQKNKNYEAAQRIPNAKSIWYLNKEQKDKRHVRQDA